MVNITRPAEGICLNAGIREYLQDAQGNVIDFKNEEEAKEFLREVGFTDDDMIGLEFPEVSGVGK